MRRVLLWMLFLLAVAVVISMASAQGAGYVLIAAGDTTIELTLVLAVLILLGAFFALLGILGFLRKILDTRRGVAGWALNRRRRRGQNRTTQGLVAFAEGRWDFARKSLAKAAGNSSTPLVNYLFAARASAELGDVKAADDHLRSAALSTSGADVAIGLTQAELQIRNAQYEQALATLLRTKKDASNHPLVLRQLCTVYRALCDWQSLLSHVAKMKKLRVIDEHEAAALESEACRALLARAVQESPDALLACWKQLPSHCRQQQALVAYYAQHLLAANRSEDAEVILRQQLNSSYDTELIGFYGLAAAEQPNRQRAFVEKQLKSRPDDASLLLAMGRIYLRSGDREQALMYLERSYAVDASKAVCAELGSLHAALGNIEKSNEYLQAGLATETGLMLLGGDTQVVADEAAVFAPVDDIESMKIAR